MFLNEKTLIYIIGIFNRGVLNMSKPKINYLYLLKLLCALIQHLQK